MPENNANTPSQQGNTDANKNNSTAANTGSQENANEENPQQGSEWANYQTKELSSNSEKGDSNISASEAAEAFTKE